VCNKKWALIFALQFLAWKGRQILGSTKELVSIELPLQRSDLSFARSRSPNKQELMPKCSELHQEHTYTY
jgi:hypothetical protein